MSSQMREDADAARAVCWREMLSLCTSEDDVDRAYVFVCRGFKITIVCTYGQSLDPYSAAELADGVSWIAGCVPVSKWQAPVLRVSLTRLSSAAGQGQRRRVDQVGVAWCVASKPIVGDHVERAAFSIQDAFQRAIERRLPARAAGAGGQVVVFAIERAV
jgi:hypothetical protein